MDKKEMERRLEAAEKQNLGLLDEIKNLKAKLAEMQDEPKIPDMPYFDGNEKYWLICNDLSVISRTRCFGSSARDFNIFHSKEMAHEFSQKCKLIAMMLHCKWYLDRDYVTDWGNLAEKKFCPMFNHEKRKFESDVWEFVDHNCVYFSTSEKAEKCADWLNKHWRDTDEESV